MDIKMIAPLKGYCMTNLSKPYQTRLFGRFTLDKPLTTTHAEYLHAFSEKPHMRWYTDKIALLPDPVRAAVGLPLGDGGAYFVGDVVDEARYVEQALAEVRGLPNRFCDWQPTADNMGIEWNGMTDTYFYVEWLDYLMRHFLTPWGYRLAGEVHWQGDHPGDAGVITFTDGVMQVQRLS